MPLGYRLELGQQTSFQLINGAQIANVRRLISEHPLQFSVVPVGVDERQAEILVRRLHSDGLIGQQLADEATIVSGVVAATEANRSMIVCVIDDVGEETESVGAVVIE